MKRLTLLLLALLLVAGCGTGLDQKPARTLPAVTLTPLGDRGQAVDLRTLKGPVVLNLWAQWCHPCRGELPIYQQFHAAHPAVQLLGVDSRDTQTQLADRLLDKIGTTYPQVRDPGGHISTPAYPTLIMVDAKGHVVYKNAIVIRSLPQLEKLVSTHLKVHL